MRKFPFATIYFIVPAILYNYDFISKAIPPKKQG